MKEIKFELVIVKGKVNSGKSDFIRYAFSDKPNYIILDPFYNSIANEDIYSQISLLPLIDPIIERTIEVCLNVIDEWMSNGCLQNLVIEIPSLPNLVSYEEKFIDLMVLTGGFVRKVEIHAEDNRLAYLEEIAASDADYISSVNYIEGFLQEIIATLEHSLISEKHKNQITDLVTKSLN